MKAIASRERLPLIACLTVCSPTTVIPPHYIKVGAPYNKKDNEFCSLSFSIYSLRIIVRGIFL